MNDWTAGIGEAVSYIENNLDGEINIEKAAEKAFVSTFYFQKIFCVLCGFTIGEYIRYRRLSLAGEELSQGNAKVIDVALKYGYDSPTALPVRSLSFTELPLPPQRNTALYCAPLHL